MVTAPLTPGYDALNSHVPTTWPIRTGGINVFAAHVYDKAQTIDEFDDTPPAGGTSVRAGAKTLQSISLISDYRWLFDTGSITRALLELGPVVVGTDWLNSMFTPTPISAGNGSIIRANYATGVAGGHCYLLTGVNTNTGRYRILNSWGTGWGNGGYAYIPISDFDTLLQRGGEACLTSDLV
jgi:hypothetical protein